MKGPQLLILLLGLATAAGVLLVRRAGEPAAPTSAAAAPDSGEGALLAFVAAELDRESTALPEIQRVSPDELRERIATALDDQFGKDGLSLRARAYALLLLLPGDQDLRNQWSSALASGNRGHAAGPGHPLVLPDTFQAASPKDQGRLVRLIALSQLAPRPAESDDAHLAGWAIRGGVAAEIEARYLESVGGVLPLPSQDGMDHEALLLSLPLYTHNLVQLPLMQGRDAVRRRLAAGETLTAIVADPPQHTLALLDPEAGPGATPTLPRLPGVLLEESLGAYPAQLLCERLSDYVVAEELGPAWRGDRYSLFQDDGGEHLFWVSHWANPAKAEKFAALLQRQVTPDDPSGRFLRVRHEGATVHFANCASQFTLDEILPAPVGSPPEAP